MVRSQTEMCSFKGDCRESPLHILEPCGNKGGNGKHKRVQRKRPSRRVLHLEFCPDSVPCQHLRLLSPSSACGFVILRQLLLSTQFPLGHETTAANPRRNGLNLFTLLSVVVKLIQFLLNSLTSVFLLTTN